MIELFELIRDLRAELSEAIAAAPASGLWFELGPVEIEASISVEKSASGAAKVRFWVVEAGSEAALSSSSLQRVKITLQPRIAGTDSAPYVSGTEEARERYR
jgi:hypothetical protein